MADIKESDCGIHSDWMFDFTRKPISHIKQVS